MSEQEQKLRILWCGDASFLETGYGRYAREILTRLHQTGEFDIAELGSYAAHDDDRRLLVPWKYYGNEPSKRDSDEEHVMYKTRKTNEYGEWRFEEVLLDFKPDVVIDVRDFWMVEYQARSPLRRFFHWIIMPPVDSEPQMEQWISTYQQADSVFAYSEYGKEVLERQTNGDIKVVDVASPGIDIGLFKPAINKKALKDMVGLTPDTLIIGSVMRNQRRKLFPDLIYSYAQFCDRYPNLAQNIYLYLHTSYPDAGWDIPQLVRESGVSHKILFTYVCRACRGIFPAHFQDARMACVKCGRPTAQLPYYQVGVTDDGLAQIYNLFDLYVQYSICEGFGMPQVEAASCGVPVMAVDYSAMSSVLKNVRGTPIPVERYFRECESMAYRAYPDNESLISGIHKFFTLPEPLRLKKSREAFMGVRKHYTWDLAFQKWYDHLKSLVGRPRKHEWDEPPHIHEPQLNRIPVNISNDDFVKWCVVNIWGEPDQIDSFFSMKVLRDLNYGVYLQGEGSGKIYRHDASPMAEGITAHDMTQEVAARRFYEHCNVRNYWERRRVGRIQEAVPPFISEAKEAYDVT
jgi:glycosyltransferase involved in cell wall biosynthesis